MGLLETLISNAIRQSTGFDAGRLVHRIGAKNILLAGGAILAGGLAAERYRQTQGGASGGSFAGVPPRSGPLAPPPPPPPAFTPPPPPPAASVAAPLPPPVPTLEAPATGTGENEGLPPQAVFPIVRTMIAAALADGGMSPEERTAIQQQLDGSGLSDEQTAQIHRELVLPASPEEIGSFAAAPEAREVLYRFAALALVADRSCTPAERSWLDRLATALELSPESKAALEKETLAALA